MLISRQLYTIFFYEGLKDPGFYQKTLCQLFGFITFGLCNFLINCKNHSKGVNVKYHAYNN